MPNIVGPKGQVVIAKGIRDSLGIAPGWVSLQRLVDDHVEIHFLPPEHRESLEGSPRPLRQGSCSTGRRMARRAGASLERCRPGAAGRQATIATKPITLIGNPGRRCTLQSEQSANPNRTA